MAKKNQGCDYNLEVKKIKTEGPDISYIIFGPEDYLRNSFLKELKKICIPDGESSFNFHRFDGPQIDQTALNAAIDSMPFMGERTFIEIHDPELSKITIEDIPSYCTVVIICDDVDSRLKIVKSFNNVLYFAEAEQNALIKWVKRRFDSYGKTIDDSAVKQLIFISGEFMNMLIPEIEKIAAYSKNTNITVNDINAVANHIADADIFEMVDCISEKKFDHAVSLLSDLLSDKNNNAVSIISSISYQFRRLYISKVVNDSRKLMSLLDIKYDFIANKLLQSSKKFSLEYLKEAVKNCCEAEYNMKFSNDSDNEIIKSLLIKLWKN